QESIPFLLSMIDELGGPRTYNHYPVGWAHAMDTPMQWTKQVASHFGGTRNGMVISWPARIKDKGGAALAVLPRNRYHADHLRGRENPSTGYTGWCEAEAAGRQESRVHLRQWHGADTARHSIFRDDGKPGDLQGRLDGEHDATSPALDKRRIRTKSR